MQMVWLNGLPSKQWHTLKEWFLSNIHSNWTILDIGSNDGKMPKLLATKASLVYGIEIWPQLVAKAKQENSEANIQYFCENPTRLQFLTYHNF